MAEAAQYAPVITHIHTHVCVRRCTHAHALTHALAHAHGHPLLFHPTPPPFHSVFVFVFFFSAFYGSTAKAARPACITAIAVSC